MEQQSLEQDLKQLEDKVREIRQFLEDGNDEPSDGAFGIAEQLLGVVLSALGVSGIDNIKVNCNNNNEFLLSFFAFAG